MTLDRTFIDQWIDAIHTSAACRTAGRRFDAFFTLGFGPRRFTFDVRRGMVESVVEDGGPLVPSSFLIEGAEEVWQALFEPNPPAMVHDLFACIARGSLRFEGDIKPLLQQLQTLSYWVAAARSLSGPTLRAPDPEVPDSYQATGRFVNVTLDDVLYKVFYLEAGKGTPVLLQHTAGNENRQWRHLLEDRELTERYRFIAYDLPSHGKSDPPQGIPFWEEDQPLRSEWVTRFVVALSEALRLERPIFVGCSIGGVIATHLAERFPERFRGLVGLAGAIPTGGFYHDWWIHPELNTPGMIGGVIDGVVAAGIPEWDHQVTSWFQQANPKNLRNDLYLWGVDNGDEERMDRIDPRKVPLYLYAGEYDYTCPPELVEACAKRIGPEVHYEMLRGLGHFPMSENYELFRPTLVRTLDEIEAGEASR